jgi:diguanylate cyclase (GGDEF)-like protein
MLRPPAAPDARFVATHPFSPWAPSDAGPVVPDLQHVAIANSRFFAIGGTAAMLVTLLPHVVIAHLILLRVEASLALACGLLWHVAHPVLPRWAYHAVNPVGTSLITLAIWLSGGGMSGTAIAMLYTIMPLHGFSFYRSRTAGLLMVFLSAQTLPLWWPMHLLRPEIVIAGNMINIATAITVTSLMAALRRSEYDAVTGLPNRRGFDLALDRSQEDARRDENPLSVGYLDLDRFREVNQNRGRTAGDQVLLTVGNLWRSLLPPEALLAHNGGGTFMVLLPGQDTETAGRTMEGLRSARLPDRVTASAGIAQRQQQDTASTLLSRADTSLYRAKQAGRDRMDPEIQQSAAVRDLQAALCRGEFVVLYQPIVELRGEQTVAAEALVRWDHPTRGRVGPDEFIPLAEESGLIVELGLRVLKDACRTVVTAEREGRRLGRVSVNVSGRQLQQPRFALDVLGVLEEAGLEPNRLILEVTESVLGDDQALAVQTLGELRRQGILVAIDDFGTGHSSLSRLTQLPVDILKIDKSFVGATDSGAGQSIIAAVTALAEALHLDTVAEGIETSEHAAVVSGFGCRRGQGWLYGRPAPMADLDLPPVPRPRGTAASQARTAAVTGHA